MALKSDKKWLVKQICNYTVTNYKNRQVISSPPILLKEEDDYYEMLNLVMKINNLLQDYLDENHNKLDKDKFYEYVLQHLEV